MKNKVFLGGMAYIDFDLMRTARILNYGFGEGNK